MHVALKSLSVACLAIAMPLGAQAEIVSATGTPFGDTSLFEESVADPVSDLIDGPPEKESLKPSILRYDDQVEIEVPDVPVTVTVNGQWNFKAKCRIELLFHYTETRNADGLAIPNAVRNMRAGAADHNFRFDYHYDPENPGTRTLFHYATADKRPSAAVPEGFLGNAVHGEIQLGRKCDDAWPAPLADDLRPISNDGLKVDCEIRHVSTMRILDPRPATFSAVARTVGNNAHCLNYGITVRINAPEPPFDLLATEPGTEACGVVEPEGAKLRVRFDEAIDPASVRDNVRLRAVGSDTTYPVRLKVVEEDRISIEPDADLPMAIKLLVEIRTGTSGLTSAGGVPLRDQPGWLEALRFHTSPISENKERTEGFIDRAALYQTVKDRQLIRDKWAVARLWPDWTIEGNETEGLQDFCVTARAVDAGSDAILFPDRDGDIQRQDDYDDEDRRLGKHTINLFGWKADGSVSTIRYEVEPRKYFKDGDAAAETPKAKRVAAIAHLPHDPATIILNYARLSLEDIGGDANEPASKLDINVKSAETFMWQVMPIGDANSRNLGTLTLDQLGILSGRPPELYLTAQEQENFRQMVADEAVQQFGWRYCHGHLTVCILSVPTTKAAHASMDWREEGWLSRRLRFAEAMFARRPDLLNEGQAIAHEVGHGFGLAHIPRVGGKSRSEVKARFESNSPFQFGDFDSLRMARDGQSAHYKRAEDGNSENPRGIFPLMFPTLTSDELAMITDQHYDFLQGSIYGGKVVGPQKGISSTESGQPPSRFYARLTFGEFISAYEADRTVLLVGDPGGQPVPGHFVGFHLLRADGTDHLVRTGDARPASAVPPASADADGALRISRDGTEVLALGRDILDRAMQPLVAGTPGGARVGRFEVFVPGAGNTIEIATGRGERIAFNIAARPPLTSVSAAGSPAEGMEITWDAFSSDLPASVILRDGDGDAFVLATGTDNGRLSIAPERFSTLGSGQLQLAVGTPDALQTADIDLSVAGTLSVETARFKANASGGAHLELSFNTKMASANLVLGYAPRDIPVGSIPIFAAAGADADSLVLHLPAPPASCETLTLEVVEASGLPDDLQVPERLELTLDGNAKADCEAAFR